MRTPDWADPVAGPSIQAAVEITEALMALPAVATTDWCDRAAAAVARLARSGIALVLAAMIDESGRILSHEAVGVAAGNHGPDRARGLGPHPPRLVRDGPVEAAVLDAIRSRAERLSHIGWTPEGGLNPGAGPLGAMPSGRNWRAGPVGRLWGELAPAELLVGLTPLGEFERGRVLAVHFAPPGVGSAAPADEAPVLRAVLPVLARRALLAMGPLRSKPAQWLTPREQAVLDRLIAGRTARQIADELGRSPHTILDNVKSLHRKLGASNRGELIARAVGYFGDDNPATRTPRPPRRRAPDAQPSAREPKALSQPRARLA